MITNFINEKATEWAMDQGYQDESITTIVAMWSAAAKAIFEDVEAWRVEGIADGYGVGELGRGMDDVIDYIAKRYAGEEY